MCGCGNTNLSWLLGTTLLTIKVSCVLSTGQRPFYDYLQTRSSIVINWEIFNYDCVNIYSTVLHSFDSNNKNQCLHRLWSAQASWTRFWGLWCTTTGSPGRMANLRRGRSTPSRHPHRSVLSCRGAPLWIELAEPLKKWPSKKKRKK